jgi:two-component system sensor histidine kinase KdpD
VRQRETVPDAVVRRAEQIELVDMSPQALRRRLAHGNVYPPDRADAALAHWFRPGNLAALRELALLWTADRADEYLRRYRSEQGIATAWPTRERVVVGLTGGPEGPTLIRRAARIASRGAGGELLAVHVVRPGAAASPSPYELAGQRGLVEDLGGSYHAVLGADVPAAVLEFARGVEATQIVLGVSRRPAWRYLLDPGVGATVTRGSGDIDVHVVPHEHAAGRRPALPGRGPAGPGGLGGARTVAGWLLGCVGPVLLTLLLAALGTAVGLPTAMLLFLTLTVGAALAGGVLPAVVSALWGSLLLNYWFTPPTHTLTISDPENVLALAVFVGVGSAVASVVDLAARRGRIAARSRAEAETLAFLAGSALRDEDTPNALLATVRDTFQTESAALLERGPAPGAWRRVAAAGEHPAERPEDATVDVPVGTRFALVLTGRVLPAEDRRILTAFAAQAAALLERRRLTEEAATARRLAEGNRIRTALLAAVSHDLRTPLAAIKAAVSSLRSPAVEWAPADREELLAGIEDGADRLNQLVSNLLDMSRLRTGTVAPRTRPTGLDEVVPLALAAVPPGAVRLEIPEDLPLVPADPGLLERVVANLVENAVTWSPPGVPVTVRADVLDLPGARRLEVRVADRGPGLPPEARESVFQPFQRYGDAPRGTGVGLGLAVARGFTEAMRGELTMEDTPGGGLTTVVSLPLPAAPGAVRP